MAKTPKLDVHGVPLTQYIESVRARLSPLHARFIDENGTLVAHVRMTLPAECMEDGRARWSWETMDYEFAWLEWHLQWTSDESNVGYAYRSVYELLLAAGAPGVRRSKREAARPSKAWTLVEALHMVSRDYETARVIEARSSEPALPAATPRAPTQAQGMPKEVCAAVADLRSRAAAAREQAATLTESADNMDACARVFEEFYSRPSK